MLLDTGIEDTIKFIGLVVGTILSVLALSKKFRTWIKLKYKNHKEFEQSKLEVPKILTCIKEKVEVIDERLKKVEHEVTFNGGSSMKDALRVVKAEIDATNWLAPRPTFRTTSDGLYTFANAAFCHLCNATQGELLKLGWKNFALDEEQADDFMNRWLLSSNSQSQFSSKLKLKNNQNDYVGEWLFKIRPLVVSKSETKEYLWQGTLHALDEVAQEYAKSHNIPVN